MHRFMNRTVTWGILGTGDIARQMASDLRLVPGAALSAVASRSRDRAELFGDTHGISKRYARYEDLVADPAIDVVYIATPHSRHCDDTLRCLAGGKAVLCEKPLAMNGADVERMVAAARVNNCFLMEGLWTAFFPAIQSLKRDLAEGVIGTPRLLTANFSYKAAAGPESRLFNPDLGGGALLDIGIYTVVLADLVFGVAPESIESAWTPASTGVDGSAAIILDYGEGRRALLNTSLTYDAPQEAVIAGDQGCIRIPHRFSQPDTYTVAVDGKIRDHHFPREGFGYHLEARAVGACVRAGQTSCPVVPWSMSQRIVQTLDRIRASWGLRYPMERGVD